MVNRTPAKLRAAALAVLATAAVVLAGCGSSSSSSSSTATAAPAAASSTASSTSTPSAASVSIAAAKGPHGTYLTGENGRALYLWVPDSNGKSVCSGACAKAWPPLISSGKPTAGSGVDASKLGTITRADGSKQVTYAGHPLYYFIADRTAGSLKGQGSNSFGAPWWLVAPSGRAITSGGSASSSSSSGGGYG